MATVKPLSPELNYTMQVCSMLSNEELFGMLSYLGEQKEPVYCHQEWATATAAVIATRFPDQIRLN